MSKEFNKIIEIAKHPRFSRRIGDIFGINGNLAIKPESKFEPRDPKLPNPPDNIFDFSDFSVFDGFSTVDDTVNEYLNNDIPADSNNEPISLTEKARVFKEQDSIIYAAIMGTVYESASSGGGGGCGPCGGDGATASGSTGSKEGGGSHEHCKSCGEDVVSGRCKNGHRN